MTSKELRIGNWVSVYGEIKEVESIGSYGISFNGGFAKYTLPNLKPITLTEELLLKCGFECYAESCVSKVFSIGINTVTNDFMLKLTWLKDIFNNNLDTYPFYRNGHHVIKHLHQLQNLFYALTGQELEIKF